MENPTKDYEMFVCAAENRNVRPLKVRRLKKRIQENNFLRENPIIVKRHNDYKDKLIVLDGQHRLCAARELGIEIHYIISDKMSMLDVPGINTARASWIAFDYLNYYVKTGNKDYEIIQFFCDKYGFAIYSTLEIILNTSSGSNINERFKQGQIVVGNTAIVKERMESISEFKHHFRHYKNKSFIRAMLIAMRSGNYDRKRMMKKMEYLSRKLVKCPDTITYLENLEELYNYNQAKEECVSFSGGYKA